MIVGEDSGVYFDMQPLRLHPLYGIPYIPASVIKGTLRSIWSMEHYGGNEDETEKTDGFVQLFGGTGKKAERLEGKLKFFDIYPEKFSIGLDVQTVHYKDYYDSQKQPADDRNALPIYFACLSNVVFPIYLASDDIKVWAFQKKEIDVMMKCMITQYGIGAKTALGYGGGSLDCEQEEKR